MREREREREREVKGKIVRGFMDCKTLYPSPSIKLVKKILFEMIEETEVKVEVPSN